MHFDDMCYQYPSRRTVRYSHQGMVATCHPLAAQAGLDMLKRGGNAIDAAIAVATTLTVVEPTSNGIGGDAFAIIEFNDTLYGLNASGPSPKYCSVDGLKTIPKYGWTAVTVPGVVAGWISTLKRFGTLSPETVFEPSIRYAASGHPVAPTVGYFWKKAYEAYLHHCKDDLFQPWFDTFSPVGRPPAGGEIWRSKSHAETLHEIAKTHGESFYRGALAERICRFAQDTGGTMTIEDLASYQPEWVVPMSIPYRGFQVYELPPNGQGLVALLGLGMLSENVPDEPFSESVLHQQIEAIKIGFREGLSHIADSVSMNVAPQELITPEQLNTYKDEITRTASSYVDQDPMTGGTVYLATADKDGNMVSWIQSNYIGFGSGLVVPGTGIALHNRGCNFSLDPDHPNCFSGGKRPYHTIIPGFMKSEDGTSVAFGVMGGFMQPQGHMQVVMNLLDFNLNPQDTLNAPRWMWIMKNQVHVEKGIPEKILDQLRKRGHEIKTASTPWGFGRGQVIWKDKKGVYCGGTEPRADGSIASW